MNPKLTIAIPTYNRDRFLHYCLQSIANQPRKCEFEVVVCDNHSNDDTERVADVFKELIDLRYYRSSNNVGFDLNYIRCVERSLGDRLLVIGDDDALMPHAIETILDCDSEFHLLTPLECDFNMNPITVRNWFSDGVDANQFTSNLLDYFNVSNFEACIGAFISAMVVPRERMRSRCGMMRSFFYEARMTRYGGGFPHLLGSVSCMVEGATIHHSKNPTILNRLFNDRLAVKNPYKRSLVDLQAFLSIGRRLFKYEHEMREAFYGIHRRNFNNSLPIYIKSVSPSQKHWEKVIPDLIEVGYPEQLCT